MNIEIKHDILSKNILKSLNNEKQDGGMLNQFLDDILEDINSLDISKADKETIGTLIQKTINVSVQLSTHIALDSFASIYNQRTFDPDKVDDLNRQIFDEE